MMTYRPLLYFVGKRIFHAILGGLVGFIPFTTRSQTPRQVAEHRRYCEGVRSTLERRTPRAEYRGALTNIQSCDSSLAVTTLLAQWRKPPEDTVAMRFLATTTGQFRDQRLFDAVRRTASDRRLSREMRIATFHTLAAYADPHTIMMFRNLDQPGLSGPRYVLIGALDHAEAVSGPMPIPAAASRAAVQFIDHLGANDSDLTVRAVAKFIAQQLHAVEAARRE